MLILACYALLFLGIDRVIYAKFSLINTKILPNKDLLLFLILPIVQFIALK